MLKSAIQFSYSWSAWLLLLLIPGIAVTLILYFRLSKKYRRTRNRIISMVLHIIIVVLSVSVLSGMMFTYHVPNHGNEIILLVDVSETQEQVRDKRDEFIQTVLNDVKFDNYKIGVVTFGFNQKYAVPLTSDIESIYSDYIWADLPDTSATNIAAALNYTKTLFTPETSKKIILISDGKETDEEAENVVRAIAAQGIRIDTARILSEYEGDDVQITGVEFPSYHVNVFEECTISVKLNFKNESSVSKSITIDLYDNGESNIATDRREIDLYTGERKIDFRHTFTLQGIHKIEFKITVEDDLLGQNNQYCAYYYLQVFDKILILQSKEGESDQLKSLLTTENAFNVEIKDVNVDNDIPGSIDGLLAYDQIILNNISNADLSKNGNMPKDFVDLLHLYVNKYGGSLLTVGGSDDSGEAHAYNRSDLYGTKLQDMLPVQAINYTPPKGVIVIIDRSGSMNDTDSKGVSYLSWAKTGAKSCLSVLEDRDWFGLMTLDYDYNMILPMTSKTQQSKIIDAIDGISTADGATVFPGAIDRAGAALKALKVVDKRHIIIVTDGGVPDNQREQYEEFVKGYYDSDGITLSVIGIGIQRGNSPYDHNTKIEALNKDNLTTYEKMLRAVILGHGVLYPTDTPSDLTFLLQEDLYIPEVAEVKHKPFYPTIYNSWSPLFNQIEPKEDDKTKMSFELGGFYGTRLKSTAELILTAEYEVPIYAQWKFGKGMVGSFMCDLQGTENSWSFDFLQDINGKQFIFNAINNLMPIEDIRPNEISITLKEYNYISELSVYGKVESGQYILGQIVDLSSDDETVISLNEVAQNTENSDCYVTLALGSTNNYSRTNFVIKKSGVYKLILTKYNSAGGVIGTFTTYKTFSYSKEYDIFMEEKEIEGNKALMAVLASRGRGKPIDDLENPVEISEGFITGDDKVFDPRYLFIILTIVLFLMDIAVRKFKFKWPHELYRQYKEKKLGKKI